MPNPGEIWVNHATQVPEFDDGDRVREILKAGVYWDPKIRPDTGADVTAKIQEAFDKAPIGCIILFEPGVYIIVDTVWLSRQVNVSAYNVIFDLTTSNPTTTFVTSTYALPATYTVGGAGYLNRAGREATTLGTEKFNTAAFVWGTNPTSGVRPNRTFVRGLRVRRTASATGPAGRKHCGIVIKSAFEVRLEDTYSENFFGGLVLTNHTGQGTVYNSISKHTSWNDRYHFNLYAVDGGWVNQNTFYDIRNLTSTSAGGVAESITDPGPLEMLRIMMHSASTSRPNNNVFVNPTLENGASDKCGRKLRLECSDTTFIDPRLEGLRTNTESLTNGELTGSPPAEWTAGGDFAFSGTAATFTPSTNAGTLTQTSANFAVAITANAHYRFEVATTGTLPEGITMEVSGITDFTKRICVNTHTGGHAVEFFSGATPGDLVFSVTVPDTHNTAITFDTLRLERIEHQITIGAADGATTNSSNWQRNIIEGGGTHIATIYERGQIEFLQSTAWAWNQGNQFNGGRTLEWSSAGSPVANKAAYRFLTTSTIHPILSFGHPNTGNEGTDNLSDVLKLWTFRSSIPWIGSAMWAYADNGGVTRNWFGMDALAPFDMRTWGGMNVGGVFRVRRDGFGSSHPYYVGGTAGLIENNNDDKIYWNTRTVNGGLIFYNGNSGVNQLFAMANSSRAVYWDFRISHSSLVSGQWGAIAMFVGSSPPSPSVQGSLANGISLASTRLGGHDDAYPIAFQRGIIINREGVDADTQMRGLNDDNLAYLDAGNDRIGIGTNAPAYKFHVAGAIGANELFIRNGSTENGYIGPPGGTGGTDVDDVQYDQLRRAQGGRHFFTGGTAQASADTPVIGVMNVAGGGGALMVLYDSAGDRLMTFRIGNDSWTNSLGNIEFYDATGATLYNALFQYDTVMGAGRPLAFRRGIWINHEQGDADTRMSSDTQTDCFYLDASALSGAGAIGVGTATPDSKLHVVGKIHGTDELELDGALNHDGTTLGVYGAAPVTQPTVTGSRGGNAALASLLTALASQGIIIDSSSA